MEYFFERISRAFSFIREAVAMAFRDKDLFVPSLLSLLANGVYIALILVVLASTNTLWLIGMEPSDVEAMRQTGRLLSSGPQGLADDVQASVDAQIEEERLAAENASRPSDAPPAPVAATRPEPPAEDESRSRVYARTVFGVLTVFGAIFITYFFSAMTVSLVYDHLSGKDARLSEALSHVLTRIPAITLLAVVSTAVTVLTSLMRGERGRKNVLGSIIASVIERLWTIASFLVLPAMVIHDLSLTQALKRAKEIASKNLLVVAVGEIGVGLVSNIITFLGIAGGFIVGFFTYRVIPQPFFVPVSVGGLIAVVAIAFAAYVKIAYYTCLYLNAYQSADAGRRVAPTGPLAAALS